MTCLDRDYGGIRERDSRLAVCQSMLSLFNVTVRINQLLLPLACLGLSIHRQGTNKQLYVHLLMIIFSYQRRHDNCPGAEKKREGERNILLCTERLVWLVSASTSQNCTAHISIMSRLNPPPQRGLTLTEELERLEQQITLTLQGKRL